VTRTTRKQLARALTGAFADGLISDQTFTNRLERVLSGRLIDVNQLIGDLRFRAPPSRVRSKVFAVMMTVVGRLEAFFYWGQPMMLLALDCASEPRDLLIGRSSRCDVVLSDPSVSRRHARVIFRDGAWVFQDLGSTNGSTLNGRRVGRGELRPGDRLMLGRSRLRVI
jgi:hypothetical protein